MLTYHKHGMLLCTTLVLQLAWESSSKQNTCCCSSTKCHCWCVCKHIHRCCHLLPGERSGAHTDCTQLCVRQPAARTMLDCLLCSNACASTDN
ncbi:hypothetical protein COO60DRAFT_1018165 [Scenedesmus sp. NREL 46B-D3]|nr:hypothetical protein COO60DRAFT_1018165 [Scenedesmus sp. NREL 46B-D3]